MANLKSELGDINKAGSPDYRPDPNQYMPVNVLLENKAFLLERLALWEWRLSDAKGDKKWAANAQKGIDILKAKIAKYDTAIAALSPALSGPVNSTDAVSDAGQTTVDNISVSANGAASSTGAGSVAGAVTGGAGLSSSPSTTGQSAQGFLTKYKKPIMIGLAVILVIGGVVAYRKFKS